MDEQEKSSITVERLRTKAEAGNLAAQSMLGISYLFGSLGVDPDEQEAFRWLSKATERGAPRSAVWLGTMYEKGCGVARDVATAQKLYQRGAERGEFLGCIFLARLLASGDTGCADTTAALRWYREALLMGDTVQECAELEEAKKFVGKHGVSREGRD
jgi:localization factor PodJL